RARPLGSRWISTGSIRTGRSRSATRRWMIASCWASLRPKTLRCGRVSCRSLATTVTTPSKCPGRAAPSRIVPARPAVTETVGGCQIRVEGARVGLVVLVGAELEGVDEIGEDHVIGELPGPLHQRQVAVVERAHGEHRGDGAGHGGALLVQRGLGGEEPRTCTARWFPGHPSSFLGGRSSSRSRILARGSWGRLARARAASARAR